jgi:hypothetical protein
MLTYTISNRETIQIGIIKGKGRQSCLAMKTDGNGRKNPISTSVSIIFCGNGIGFGKYGFENGIGICGHTETNKYGWRAGKLN